jgi:hypothetical protein
VEAGLERDLMERRDIGPAERAALRAQARAIDAAERFAPLSMDAVDSLTKANAVYLQLRQAAGLSSAGAAPVDAVDQLLAEILRPGAGAGDVPNT